MDQRTIEHLERQQYRIVGGTGAVKLCHWMRQKLIHGRPCYKEEFYGIDSHRCLQMTPAVNICNFRCLFCWRFHGMTGFDSADYPEPEELLDRCIQEQRLLVSGFKGDERCDPERLWEEARNPNQVAISLSGEPTLYPELGEFIALCKRRGMTTFLVTNGSVPKALAELSTTAHAALRHGRCAEQGSVREALRAAVPARLGQPDGDAGAAPVARPRGRSSGTPW